MRRKNRKRPAPPPRVDEFLTELDFFDAVQDYLLSRGENALALDLFVMSTEDITATLDNYSKAGM